MEAQKYCPSCQRLVLARQGTGIGEFVIGALLISFCALYHFGWAGAIITFFAVLMLADFIRGMSALLCTTCGSKTIEPPSN